MGSKREEERNEKIIRGLMKLPPNRRCINCNSLVPQYVCTNFWTFVCTTCSGIHREFTHRVKSVSMAKFTTQELEALQNGGNQRAREIYLKEWDAQNLRLPDNSNPDKIREFIKNVYVNKKYVGGKSSDNASSDVQHLSSHEDESRRASSYHSYSQSPPYDFQYEERRYGKRTSAALSRKPGSDRGLYEKHFSSFLSPGRPVDHRSPNHVIEDRFAIERSNSRASDCSVSSGAGDPLKSDIQSPNFQKDNASVVSSETSREFSSEDLNHLRNSNVDLFSMTDGGNMPHPQRAVSLPVSYGVPNNHLPPSKSIDNSTLPSLSQSSPPMNFNGLDLFDAPFAPQVVTSTAPIINTSSFPDFPSKTPVDLFQPFTSNHIVTSNQVVTSTAPIINTSSFPDFPSKSPVDLFQPFTSNHIVTSNQVVTSTSPIISTSSFPEFPSKTPMDLFQPFASNHVAQAEPPSPTLFSEISNQSPSASFPEKSSDVVLLHPNEGWATFDFPQQAIGVEKSTTVNFPGDTNSIGNLEQWPPSAQHAPSHGPSSAILPIWHNDPQSIEAVPSIASTQVWNAFEDSNGHLQISQEFHEYGNESVSGASIPPMPSAASHSDIPLHDFSGIPGAGSHSFTFNHVSTNPFDIPYDPAVEYDNVPNLWDMSSLHEALPNGQMPTSFTPAANHQPWFSDDQIDPFCPTGSEGALEFIAGQGSNKQLMNGPSQEPVASVGGNPFA